jgi:hypothetical protein
MAWGDLIPTIGIRSERVLYTLIAKKFIAWYVATWMLVKHFISGSEWVMMTAAIFGLATYEKYKGMENADTRLDSANKAGAVPPSGVVDNPDSPGGVAGDGKPYGKGPVGSG